MTMKKLMLDYMSDPSNKTQSLGRLMLVIILGLMIRWWIADIAVPETMMTTFMFLLGYVFVRGIPQAVNQYTTIKNASGGNVTTTIIQPSVEDEEPKAPRIDG